MLPLKSVGRGTGYARLEPPLSNGKGPPSRGVTPPIPEAYSFSTSLKRQSIDGGLSHHTGPANKGHSSNLSDPYGTHSHGGPFAHTARQITPSARYARMTVEDTISQLNSSIEAGLSSHVVPQLRELHGPNEFAVAQKEKAYVKFAKQFYESPLILLLLGSAVISAVVGNFDDSVSITVAIIIVVTVGFVQEQRSEKSLEALNKLVPHYCHLLRDGTLHTKLANVLVPGDIVSFSVGDRIPADVRLIRANQLEIDESSLTGETHPAEKRTASADDTQHGLHDLAISERFNIGFMGTLVRGGNGVGAVVATGDQSEFGVIFSMMQNIEERKTPLQISMDDLAKRLSAISFGVIGLICLLGVFQSRSWLEMFTIGVSLAVAAIPEGLPIVVTVTLALGVLRMSKRKAIVKKLPSVETLGSVSVICSDKTGTLTTNQMTVTRAFTVDDGVLDVTRPISLSSDSLSKTFLIGNLCNQSFRNSEGNIVGSPTEVALYNVLSIMGINDQREGFRRSSEVPFSSEQKWQSVTGRFAAQSPSSGDKDTTYASGALEFLQPMCRFYLKSDGTTAALDVVVRDTIAEQARSLQSLGLRVVGMAYGVHPDSLVFAGFQAMMDPPRAGVDTAIASLMAAGIQIVMITGDAELTALSIARQLGLRLNPGSAQCLTGRDIDAMSQRQLTDRIHEVCVFARTTPRHKMAIIEAFQSRGFVVAMTGDGVNDSPALKMADIGISMGKGGTDVAKEAADLILVDDNFATILPAVEEGKCIFYNIQNFLCFQLSTAVAALTLITLSTAFGLPNPLNPMQILFINILMDGPPSQSLGVDPVNREVMQRPPRKKNAPVLTKRLLIRILFSASIIVLGTLFIYVHELSDGQVDDRDQTMTFTTFVFLDLVSAVQNRGLTCGLLQNQMLVLTISTSFFVQILLIYFPLFHSIFKTQALSLRDLSVLLGLGATSAVIHEVRRRYERQLNEKARWETDSAV
ncbi:uncharacterized protein L969DRAFT_94276 [Mixia osmundae IAM 14324]|uniref:Calcium-transporting ATPase n=1 Tax=Mixia osmundae (strain CBS 9802 / IAM 14324 / JCM 22182 / KY 12970) TaxID=764103 RepID=G7E8D4_MIXOS|nr:uncharacterized protein L969DRAFT_94276 [Mixia osmundae IAM 14324]KEI39197.1 hypothetical protein L969DRAFT_94276 [Mixia osmundae IAM 14324]GAA99094.1 hypothetical protein E5Q_05783 [Mixia osmundae IAM 14324]